MKIKKQTKAGIEKKHNTTKKTKTNEIKNKPGLERQRHKLDNKKLNGY